MLEFIDLSVRAASLWAAAWKLQVFQVHHSHRPLAALDPSVVEVELLPRVQCTILSLKKADRRRLAADYWSTELEALGSDSDDDDDGDGASEGLDAASDASAEMDCAASCGDSGSSESEVDASCAGSVGESSSGSDSEPPPPPAGDAGFAAAGGDPLAAAASDDGEGGLEAAGDTVPVPAAKRPRPPRASGPTRELEVPGGILRYYEAKAIVVAHCSRHGEQQCRLTRSLLPSTARGRAGQGRPLGLCLAWLGFAADEEYDDADSHKRRPKPSLEERTLARAEFSTRPEAPDWLELERPVRPEEEEEPELVP